MKKINLKDFYYWYIQDEYIEVPDAVAAALFKDKRYNKIHEQRVRRNKSYYSLDAGDGIETAAITYFSDSPEYVCQKIEKHCGLCQALNFLPEAQGRRVEAHYLLGMSQRAIARADGVCVSSVNESVKRGLRAMKKYLQKNG